MYSNSSKLCWFESHRKGRGLPPMEGKYFYAPGQWSSNEKKLLKQVWRCWSVTSPKQSFQSWPSGLSQQRAFVWPRCCSLLAPLLLAPLETLICRLGNVSAVCRIQTRPLAARRCNARSHWCIIRSGSLTGQFNPSFVLWYRSSDPRFVQSALLCQPGFSVHLIICLYLFPCLFLSPH